MDNAELLKLLKEQGQMIAELAAQMKAMQAAADAAAEAAKPRPAFVQGPPKIDFTQNLRMPASATAMVAVVDDRLMRSIVSDHFGRSSVHSPSSIISQPRSEPKRPRGTGFIEAKPLGPQPGVDVADRIIDAADAEDRAALEQRLAGKEKVR